jgi:hypothetical protein
MNALCKTVVQERLLAIVRAVRGSDVGTNGEEFWFVPESAPGLQFRLSPRGPGCCYDESANFAISYAGVSVEALSVVFWSVSRRLTAPQSMAPLRHSLRLQQRLYFNLQGPTLWPPRCNLRACARLPVPIPCGKANGQEH